MRSSRLSLSPAGRVVVALSVGLLLVLTACGGDDEPGLKPKSDEGSPTNIANAVNLDGIWPLGEKLDGDLPEHPVYVVKMDNTAGAAPQVGLATRLDLVVEELVEGGLTRLAIFYYQDIPGAVGPVRSLRATDIGVVKSVAATVVASGAARPTTRRLAAADIMTTTEGADGFYRDDDRTAPYNLFFSLADVAAKPDGLWGAPENAYFAFGDGFEGDTPVSKISAEFSAGHTTNWEFADGAWTRPGSFAQDGKDFQPDNILLLRVQTRDAGYVDGAGNPVPETLLTGNGDAVLVHGDKAMKLTWAKPVPGSPLKLKNAQGKAIDMPVGRTWVELVPSDGGNVTLSK